MDSFELPELRFSVKVRKTECLIRKKLTNHGNSLALVIDRPTLDLLKIDTDTRLIVAPAAVPLARRKKFDAAQEWAQKRYGKVFEKLAK